MAARSTSQKTGSTKPAWRHHYVPQFYLREWADADGKLWCYSRAPSGKLLEKRVPPRATAFDKNLYSIVDAIPYLPEREPDVVERRFLSPLDDAAASVFRRILSNEKPLTDQDRTIWAAFLNSLLERDHRTLRNRDKMAPAISHRVAAELLEKCKGDAARARMQDVLDGIDTAAMTRNILREHMMNEIRDKQVLDYFKNQRWTVLRLGAGLELITSDAPLIVNCGRSPAPIEMLALALGPHRLFLMHPTTWELDDESLMNLVLIHNLSLVEGGGRFLYSATRAEDGPHVRLRFAIENFFSGSRAAPA